MKPLTLLVLLCLPLSPLVAQESVAEPDPAAETAAVPQDAEVPSDGQPAPSNGDTNISDTEALEEAKETATELVDNAKERVGELADSLDQNRTVQEVSTSILNPIYVAAEAIAFPAFYWVAFALMAAGVVNYAFQLVLGKLVVLIRGSINIREILSDFVGLLISVIGLVLTTQAATENSTFPDSPTAVLSAAIFGAVLGLILYRWNQTEEVDAVRGRQHRK